LLFDPKRGIIVKVNNKKILTREEIMQTEKINHIALALIVKYADVVKQVRARTFGLPELAINTEEWRFRRLIHNIMISQFNFSSRRSPLIFTSVLCGISFHKLEKKPVAFFIKIRYN
jgi:hypothetical protein